MTIKEQNRYKKDNVSIVMPTYNYGPFIDEAIASVLNQAYKNFELIIVDDGSTDNTEEVLKKYTKNKQIKLYKNQENKGVCYSKIKGANLAKGEYLMFMDSDDILDKKYLITCIDAFKKKPNIDIVYTSMKLFGDSNIIQKSTTFSPGLLFLYNYIGGASVMKREAYDISGGIDISMEDTPEDWDLWLSMAETGSRGFYIDNPLHLYRKHKGSRDNVTHNNNRKRWKKIQKKHFRSYLKYFPKNIIEYSLPYVKKGDYRMLFRKGRNFIVRFLVR
ncbi:MAG: glycosyltransferase [bacterium]|nr:glycosyltransferase [bacterium]